MSKVPSRAMGSTAAASWSTSSSCEPTWVCTPSSRSTALRSMRRMRRRASSGISPNFEPAWPVACDACVAASTPGITRTRHGCRVPAGTMRSSRSMSSKLSTTISPTPRAHGELEFLVGLGVAVQHQPGRVGTGLQRAVGSRRRPRRRGAGPRPPSPAEPPCTGTTSTRTPRPPAASGCGTRPGSRGPAGAVRPPTPRWRGCRTVRDVVEPAAADDERAVLADRRARRKQPEQIVGRW